MTPETINKLEEAFLSGANDKEAIFYANIGSSTFYEYCQANPDFAERKEALKESIKLRAKMNIADAINHGDKPLSQWYLERKAKDEFSQKQEQEVKGGLTINIKTFGDNDPLSMGAGSTPAANPSEQSAVQDDRMAPQSKEDDLSPERADPMGGVPAGDVLVRGPVLQPGEEDRVAGTGDAPEVLPTGDMGQAQ